MSSRVYLYVLFFLFYSCTVDQSRWYGEKREVGVPCLRGGESNLFLSPHGEIYLSWLEYEDDSIVSLKYSKWLGEQWSSSVEISRGADWFVNWADFPSMASGGNDGAHLLAQYLSKSGAGSYDYNIMISQSFDYGETWHESEVLHKDSMNAEHGFVSIQNRGEDGFSLAWLDGRNTKNVHSGHEHGHGGSMSLRYTEIDSRGSIAESVELDRRVCDCCQTDMAMTEGGAVVVYRDRSEGEIRDIYLCKQRDGIWLEPRVVYQDNWEISGCPVNGPAVDALGNNLVVFWYTMNGDKPLLRYAISEDGGDCFFEVKQMLTSGRPIGRVDVRMFDEDRAILVWMEEIAGGKSGVMAKKIDFSGGEYETTRLLETEVSRASGFPRMVIKDGRLLLTWTVLQDADERIKSMLVELN